MWFSPYIQTVVLFEHLGLVDQSIFNVHCGGNIYNILTPPPVLSSGLVLSEKLISF